MLVLAFTADAVPPRARASSSGRCCTTPCTRRPSWSATTSGSAARAAGNVEALRTRRPVVRVRRRRRRSGRGRGPHRVQQRDPGATSRPVTSRRPPSCSAGCPASAGRSYAATPAAASSATRPPTSRWSRVPPCRPTGSTPAGWSAPTRPQRLAGRHLGRHQPDLRRRRATGRGLTSSAATRQAGRGGLPRPVRRAGAGRVRPPAARHGALRLHRRPGGADGRRRRAGQALLAGRARGG